MGFPTWRQHFRAKAIQMIADVEAIKNNKKKDYRPIMNHSVLSNAEVRELNKKLVLTKEEEKQFQSLCRILPFDLNEEFDADMFLKKSNCQNVM